MTEIENLTHLRALVGKEIGVSDWFEITQERINQFADATLDHQWIHINEERAKTESPFGTTIAHGFLTLSLLPHLIQQTIKYKTPPKMGVNYGLNRLRFTSPVPAGSNIRARVTLQSIEEISGGVQVTWNVMVEREGAEKPCLVAEWLGRSYE
ncbi:MAG: MaoC family dehydratase [Acidobacteria bacterium]|nr:MaoC family dehydratase [Acidobacteriota bacterium]